jgi:hypothetical protein
LRLAPPEGIFALDGGDAVDLVSAADRGGARFGEAEDLHLALPGTSAVSKTVTPRSTAARVRAIMVSRSGAGRA